MIPASPKRFTSRQPAILICFFLALITGIVYQRVRGFKFINFDDPFIIYNNPMVNGGWTARGILWGLTTSYFEYWHPIAWWSHMTDCQLFGLAAGWHHVVSLGFHVLNTLVLFGALRQLTGRLMRSAVVAALFALHPMHVESVAWLSERKDLLSALFWLLSIWAYGCYVQKLEAKNHGAEFCYRVSLAAFLCGLMSKPMVVTLPFVLLLLDYWPLNRFAFAGGEGAKSQPSSRGIMWNTFVSLVKEKLPFFGFTLMSCVITFLNVRDAHNILSAAIVPWSFRLGNVPISYARYLGKLFWPGDMILVYPLAKQLDLMQMAGSLLIIVAVTLVVIRLARTAPYLLFGWLMFLGTIFPTLSLVPVGYQSIADRYTYLSYIGLFIALVWAMADLSVRWTYRTALLGGATVLVLLACCYSTWIQLGYWRNNFTLWPHCLSVTKEHFTAQYNLGYALQNDYRTAEAVPHLREAVRLRPDHADATLNLGRALAATGQTLEATNYFARALQLEPDSADAHGNMGMALFVLGDLRAAVAQSSEAIRLNPANLMSLLCLARSLGAQNKSDEAMEVYSRTAQLYPNRADVDYYFGMELEKRGAYDQAVSTLSEAVRLSPTSQEARVELDRAMDKRAASEGITQTREVLRKNPDAIDALNNLAWLLATETNPEFRNGVEAVQLAEHACNLTDYKQVVPIGTLAAAYAEAGQFDKAVATAQRACDLAGTLGQTNLLERNRELLSEFKKNQAHHEYTGATIN